MMCIHWLLTCKEMRPSTLKGPIWPDVTPIYLKVFRDLLLECITIYISHISGRNYCDMVFLIVGSTFPGQGKKEISYSFFLISHFRMRIYKLSHGLPYDPELLTPVFSSSPLTNTFKGLGLKKNCCHIYYGNYV